MSGKENQRIKLTKVLLRNSLIDLLHTKPISKITIKELCENAGINRSTFYLYYIDQHALLDEIENELLLHIQLHLDKIDSNTNSIHYLQELLKYIADSSEQFKTLLCRQENISFQTKFIETSIKNLNSSLILNCSEIISSYVYRFLTMGSLSIILKWIESDYDMRIDDLANMIFQMSDKVTSIYLYKS